MTRYTNAFIAAALALTIATPSLTSPTTAGPIPPSVTPVGSWETSTGESRYKIWLCGDGTDVCAKLTWLRSDARTPENLAYLNKVVVQGAKKTAPVKWEGKVVYQGEAYDGSLIMLSSHQMKMAGCRAIACNTLLFNRI